MARVLLIEPDAVLARIHAQAFQHAGYEADMASTAQGAIDKADDARPDVVVLELQLVTHSGIEFLYEFRSYPEWQNVPVIILSHVPPAEFAGSYNMLRHQLGVEVYHYKSQTNLQRLLSSIEAALVRV